jgi:hypothetical protein
VREHVDALFRVLLDVSEESPAEVRQRSLASRPDLVPLQDQVLQLVETELVVGAQGVEARWVSQETTDLRRTPTFKFQIGTETKSATLPI